MRPWLKTAFLATPLRLVPSLPRRCFKLFGRSERHNSEERGLILPNIFVRRAEFHMQTHAAAVPLPRRLRWLHAAILQRRLRCLAALASDIARDSRIDAQADNARKRDAA